MSYINRCQISECFLSMQRSDSKPESRSDPLGKPFLLNKTNNTSVY